MDPFFLIIALVAGALVGWFLGSSQKLGTPTPKTLEAAPAAGGAKAPAIGEQDALRREIDALRTKLQKAQKDAEGLAKDAASARDDAKKAKQKAHDRDQSTSKLQKQVKDLEAKLGQFRNYEELRAELIAAQSEVANLRARADRGDEPVALPEPQVVAAAPAELTDDDRSAVEAEVARRMAELRREANDQVKSYRRQVEEKVKAERARFVDELKDLRRRLNRAMNDGDRHARLVERNETAYRVLKAQLEAELDRRAMGIDTPLRRPDQDTPDDRERRRQAEAAAATSEAPTSFVAEPDAAPANEPAPAATDAPVEASAPAAENAPAAEAAPAVEAAPEADEAPAADEGASADAQAPPATDDAAEPAPAAAAPAAPPAPVEPDPDAHDEDGWDMDDEEIQRLTSDYRTVE